MREKVITEIRKPHINFKKLRPCVGIYARVSTRSAAQLHSMAAQVSQLTRFVASRNDWRLVDVYMDFESGSGSVKRPEYERMLEDAKAGRIDAVITKSVQRFGRNTEETLSIMRELLAAGVIVFFQLKVIHPMRQRLNSKRHYGQAWQRQIMRPTEQSESGE